MRIHDKCLRGTQLPLVVLAGALPRRPDDLGNPRRVSLRFPTLLLGDIDRHGRRVVGEDASRLRPMDRQGRRVALGAAGCVLGAAIEAAVQPASERIEILLLFLDAPDDFPGEIGVVLGKRAKLARASVCPHVDESPLEPVAMRKRRGLQLRREGGGRGLGKFPKSVSIFATLVFTNTYTSRAHAACSLCVFHHSHQHAVHTRVQEGRGGWRGEEGEGVPGQP